MLGQLHASCVTSIFAGIASFFMNYNGHNPPHVHVKYQNDYSIELQSKQKNG